MAMNVNTDYTNYISGFQSGIQKTVEKPEDTNDTKEAAKTDQGKSSDKDGVIYEKSQADRTAIVQKMRSETEQRKQQLVNMVQKMLTGQAGAYGKATGNDIWKMLSDGNFTVDAATKAQAQKDIGEDGYWGVKQTSQRLFDFASALAGDDADKMKEMQKAIEKGFKQAEKAWGRELPSICSETMVATKKLFDDYYKAKETVE